MSVFKYLKYKSFLEKKIRENRGGYGYKSKLARAAGCRASYFSQVLNGAFDLSPEHALGIAEFWKLSPAETDYWVHLVHYARASTPELKKYYESILRRMASEHESVLLRGNASEVENEWKSVFYSSWHYTAIHDLTTFPGGQHPTSIAAQLELPSALVNESLAELETMGLVERRGDRWHAKVVEVIVPPAGLYAAQHVSNWTRRAALDALKKKRPLESFHKCWVFGISQADYQRLRELIIDHIQQSQKIIPVTEREHLACMNLHLFEV